MRLKPPVVYLNAAFHDNNIITDVAQEVMLHMQHTLPKETKLTTSAASVSPRVFLYSIPAAALSTHCKIKSSWVECHNFVALGLFSSIVVSSTDVVISDQELDKSLYIVNLFVIK